MKYSKEEIDAKKFQDIYRTEVGKSPILQMGETALFSSDYVEWLQNKLWMQELSKQEPQQASATDEFTDEGLKNYLKSLKPKQ